MLFVDRDVVGYFGYIRPDHGFSDFNSAGSDVENFALFDRAVRAGSPEPNAAHSGVGNLARFEVYVAGKVSLGQRRVRMRQPVRDRFLKWACYTKRHTKQGF